MGNENEIEEINQQELELKKSYFLPAELPVPESDIAHKQGGYSLDEEFRKSRKNYNVKFYFVIIIFLSLLFLMAAAANFYIRYKEKQVVVSVSEYQDVNLKSILDEAKKEESKLFRVRKEIENLKESRTKEIEALQAEFAGKKEKLDAESLPAGKKRELIQEIVDQEKIEIEKVNLKYEELLKEKEIEETVLTKNVDDANQKVDESITKMKDVMSNTARLNEIRLENQKNEYEEKIHELESRYNPVFQTWQLRKILSSYIKKVPYNKTHYTYAPELKTEGALEEREFDALNQRKREFETLIRELKKGPYKNSVPQALEKIQRVQQNTVGTYDILWNNLVRSIRNKNQSIDSYQYAFYHITKTEPETGYIVDPRNSESIRVYINPVVRIRDGMQAKVFRNDDELIGMIEFVPGSRGSFAKAVFVEPGKEMRPLDKILINYKKGAR